MILKEILLAGAAQGFMLGMVILSLTSANALANRLLALFIGLESFHLFLLHFVMTGGGVSPVLLLFLFTLRVLAGALVRLRRSDERGIRAGEELHRVASVEQRLTARVHARW